MTSVIKRPRKAKVAGFMRAQNLINTKNYDVRRAVIEAGISATTYYKYLEMFGSDVTEAQKQLVVLPKEAGKVPVFEAPKTKTTGNADLDVILRENAALAEQIKLRVELSKLMH